MPGTGIERAEMGFPDSSFTRLIRTIDEATWLVEADLLPSLDLSTGNPGRSGPGFSPEEQAGLSATPQPA